MFSRRDLKGDRHDAGSSGELSSVAAPLDTQSANDGLKHSRVVSRLQALVAVVCLPLTLLSVLGILLMLPVGLGGYVDYRSFYTAGYMIRTGHRAELYNLAQYDEFQNRVVGPWEGPLPPTHMAYESLLYVPFSYLSYRGSSLHSSL